VDVSIPCRRQPCGRARPVVLRKSDGFVGQCDVSPSNWAIQAPPRQMGRWRRCVAGATTGGWVDLLRQSTRWIIAGCGRPFGTSGEVQAYGGCPAAGREGFGFWPRPKCRWVLCPFRDGLRPTGAGSGAHRQQMMVGQCWPAQSPRCDPTGTGWPNTPTLMWRSYGTVLAVPWALRIYIGIWAAARRSLDFPRNRAVVGGPAPWA